jgi:putative alpha-1,2-mannosidase
LIGQPWKTSAVVRVAQTLFTNAPNGVTGNDDLGAMSAWYLFGAMGLYPGMPGTGQLLLSAPRFESVEADLGNGHTLRLRAPGADGEKLQYVDSIRINGQDHTRVWVDWQQLRNGGEVDFSLTDRAGSSWGANPQDAPAPACPSTNR